MIFDEDGHPVNAHANRIYTDLEQYITSTGSDSKNERRLYLTDSLYPDQIQEAYIDIRYTEGGDTTNITYREDWNNGSWECRWGRHSNDHSTTEHFHYPPNPDADTDPYTCDADYDKGLLMTDTVVSFIKKRIEDIWSSQEDPTYPANYTWNNEYQPDMYDCTE